MKNDLYPARRTAWGLAGLATLTLLGAAATLAADAPVFAQADVDAPPALVARAVPTPPRAHQPLFGAQLSFGFVVDAQGLPGDVTLLEAKPTLSETGKVIEESDLPTLRRAGLLDGLPANTSFAEVRDLLLKPFLEPGKAAVLARRYRPGSKAGTAVATRVTDSVVFQADELLPPGNLPRTSAIRPMQPASPAATIEPVRPVQPDTPPPATGPSRVVTAVVANAGNASTINTPGQLSATVVRTAGRDSIINTPGEPSSSVVATPGGGSVIYTPGQAPTMVTPISGGGSIIYAPGQPPSTVVPSAGGGSTIYTPGQAPTMVVPISGGGSIIFAPGQPPVTVMPTP
ncbi:MAG: hypothetical protein RL324_943 [Verrucomicrobiota bacterium]|jgi:hypothetical protein